MATCYRNCGYPGVMLQYGPDAPPPSTIRGWLVLEKVGVPLLKPGRPTVLDAHTEEVLLECVRSLQLHRG